jgi:hypothetical protein
MKRKVRENIEGILVVTLFICASAMDSPNVLIPGMGVLVSAVGLLVMSRIEERGVCDVYR